MENAKKCSVCKKMLPIINFGVDKSRPSGINYTCRQCQSVYAKNRKINKIGLDIARKASKKYRESNREKVLAYFREWAKKNKKRRQAINAVSSAIKKGLLIKEPCLKCKAVEVEAHHCDYNKKLEVMWLCQSCHKNWHINNTPIL